MAFVLSKVGVLDLESPAAPAVLAKLTASLLISTAGVFCFLTAARATNTRVAILVATGFVLGTGLWPEASQTLWQHETAVTALMAAIWLGSPATPRLDPRRAFGIGSLLAIAGATRPQLAPAIAWLSLATLWRAPARSRLAGVLPLAVGVVIVAAMNDTWFGSLLGAMPALERVHPQVHGVTSSIDDITAGAAGLLVSPNRGLLSFSPIVLVALLGLRRDAARLPAPMSARSCAIGALVQFLFYSIYSVWWGGHTYGPRYCLDLLPLLVPAAAQGVARLSIMPVWTRWLAAAALFWSVAVAATGAFVYPHDMWNVDPLDVDRHHERLWDWRDTQITRCWGRGLSPQNFELFRSEAWKKE